jgi:peptidoglycan/xylan/chitin deacetylase (PgdA/CDA1 family)
MGWARTSLGRVKPALAMAAEFSGVNRLGLALQERSGPFIRAINYHDVAPADADKFERQVAYFATRFAPVNRTTLDLHLRAAWTSRRPGLVLTFDDGLRSHRTVVAPILEAYGFTGWFFVPSELPDVPPRRHETHARSARIDARDHFGDGRLFMTWDEVGQLDQRHEIGSHTHSHVRLSRELGRDRLDTEIRSSKSRLEQMLGHEISTFAWVGGEEYSYSREAANLIRDAGYRRCFMTNNAVIRPANDPLQLQRTNIEAHMSMATVRFQISGLMDLAYRGKRNRVNRLTAAPRSPDRSPE